MSYAPPVPGSRDPARALTVKRALFAAAVAVQLVVLYAPRAPSTGGLPIDKLVHAVIFGGVLWLGVLARIPARPLILLLGVHAVLSELIQGALLPHRDGNAWDAAADLTGVLIVTVLLRLRAARAAVPG